MTEAALSGLSGIFGCPCLLGVFPAQLAYLFAGVLIGLALGVLPGLGGLVGLAIMLPFTFTMDPPAALAMIVGLLSVANTSDTIPSVLFGIPGSAASQATILDGYPMSQNGEAGKALGAAYMASLIGGLFGAVLLGFSIPVLQRIVLAFGSPEFFMLGLLGVSMVAVLSGLAPLKGLIVGGLGLLVGMVGQDPQVGVTRWAFGQLYLWGGIPLVPLALGLFAIPETVDLLIRGTSIANDSARAVVGAMTGVRAAFKHWFLVLRCGLLGTWIGAIPGLGAAVVDWFAYGHALQTEKGARRSFGTGDVRGVIAPESANNAKEAGALVPTLAFGVPGSAAMALLMAALLIQGINPGPQMLGRHLDLTFTMVWSVPIANLMGAGICLLLTNQLAKLSKLRVHVLAPFLLSLVFLASFQASRDVRDIVVLLSFGVLGWFMKHFAWPRPPLVLGVVLATIVERNFFISVSRHGFAWMSRPIVIVIAIIIVFSVSYGVYSSRKRREPGVEDLPRVEEPGT